MIKTTILSILLAGNLLMPNSTVEVTKLEDSFIVENEVRTEWRVSEDYKDYDLLIEILPEKDIDVSLMVLVDEDTDSILVVNNNLD